MSLFTRDGRMSAADRLVGAAKRNPEGVLLLAAGCALLMRGVGAAAEALREDTARRRAQRSPNGRLDEDERPGLAESAREYASDLGERMKEGASAMAEYADEAGQAAQAAYDRSGRMVRQTGTSVRDAVDRTLVEQPLAIALFGLAAGAVLAGALPTSRMERRALEPVGESLGEAARETRSRLKRSARKAGERLSDVAEERGLSTEGLKQAAGQVAEAFASEMTGRDEGKKASGSMKSNPQNPAKAQSGGANRPMKSGARTTAERTETASVLKEAGETMPTNMPGSGQRGM